MCPRRFPPRPSLRERQGLRNAARQALFGERRAIYARLIAITSLDLRDWKLGAMLLSRMIFRQIALSLAALLAISPDAVRAG
jgi:hypothetical protein